MPQTLKFDPPLHPPDALPMLRGMGSGAELTPPPPVPCLGSGVFRIFMQTFLFNSMEIVTRKSIVVQASHCPQAWSCRGPHTTPPAECSQCP